MSKRNLRFVVVLFLALITTFITVGKLSAKSNESSVAPTKTIRVAAAQGVAQLNPYKQALFWENQTFYLLWTTLTGYTEASGGNVVPALATWTVSPSLKTYTFRLKNAQFSDGTPITAQSVIASLKLGTNKKTAFFRATFLPPIAGYTAVNARTVRIALKVPSVGFLQQLAAFPIVDTKSLAANPTRPATSGPFKITSFTPNANLNLVPNERYFGKKPAINVNVIRAQDNTSAVTSLRNGDIDVLWGVPYLDTAQLKRQRSISIIQSVRNAPWQHVLTVDLSAPPFNKLAARKALLHATDKKKIFQVAYAGLGEVSLNNSMLPKRSPYYVNLPNYDFNLAKAKQLFTQAGVRQGHTFTAWVTGGQYPEWTIAAQILQADLAKIGIKMKISRQEVNTWANRFFPKGKSYPNLIVSDFGVVLPDILNMARWMPKFYEGNWKNDKFQQLFDQADRTQNPAKRKALLTQVQRIFHADVPVIVLLVNNAPLAVRDNIKGIWLDGGGIAHFESVTAG